MHVIADGIFRTASQAPPSSETRASTREDVYENPILQGRSHYCLDGPSPPCFETAVRIAESSGPSQLKVILGYNLGLPLEWVLTLWVRRPAKLGRLLSIDRVKKSLELLKRNNTSQTHS